MRRWAKFRSLLRSTPARFITVVAVAAGLVGNLDRLASFWEKHFGETSGVPVLDDAVNIPIIHKASNSGVSLELVQAPSRQKSDELVFDVYLNNDSAKDILLVKLAYNGSGPYQLSAAIEADAYSRPFKPEYSYNIKVSPRLTGNFALSPPYLLKRRSRTAIRFHFAFDDRTKISAEDFSFSLFDASGHKVADVGWR